MQIVWEFKNGIKMLVCQAKIDQENFITCFDQ